MLSRIRIWCKSLQVRIIDVHRFLVFAYYKSFSLITLGDDTDDEHEYDAKYYTGRTPLADDIENILSKEE